jgi:hypothetical protein
MRSRPASRPSVLYHLRALLLAVSGGDKLDTMPQEGTFMKRMFAFRAHPSPPGPLPCRSPHATQKVAKSTLGLGRK